MSICLGEGSNLVSATGKEALGDVIRSDLLKRIGCLVLPPFLRVAKATRGHSWFFVV